MEFEASVLDSPALRALLQLLADGEFHSGEELGGLLGVSRAAVWKHLQKLEALGVRLQSVKGRGYCIEGGLDLIAKEQLELILNASGLGADLTLNVMPVIDSTNTFLLRQSDRDRQICIAEAQTSGRGRRGRAWISPFAQNIYLSIAWSFEGGVAAIEGLSLAVAVAVVRSLSSLGIDGVQLKWPNDVLHQRRKLAGILIEMTGDPSGYCQVVIGVGLNVSMELAAADEISQPWVDLRQIATAKGIVLPSRNQISASLIAELVRLLRDYSVSGFAAYGAEWEALNAYAKQAVVLSTGQLERSGILLGVDDVGALILQTDKGEEVFHGGELSLRVAP
jgi:BirA family transcriptional regulator, biotin operon repressor / biotin---[acetyl-CoA-carboxylase] ligase